MTHDSAGRIESWAGWTFAYDAEGRLVSACKSPTCASGSDKLAFAYDAEGHRTSIVATDAASTVTTTEFRYQGDAVVEESVNGSVARRFVTDEAGAISTMIIPTGANAGTYLVTWNGHGDALNLLRVKADGSTELANSFSYSTWGTPTVDGTHPNSANANAPYGDLGFRYLYVGQFNVQWDNTFGLGLHYMHARHNSPMLGRFLQPDPARREQNAHAYARNSPATRIDPRGLESWNMNSAEKAACGKYPVKCAQMIDAAFWAVVLSKHFASEWKENAYRHCIWNCLMTFWMGKSQANFWSYLHEEFTKPIVWYDRTVDYHNNYVGVLFGPRIWDVLWAGSAHSWAYNFCDGAWKRGWLWVYDARQRRVENSFGQGV